jgi:hypothetical protein
VERGDGEREEQKESDEVQNWSAHGRSVEQFSRYCEAEDPAECRFP